MRPYALFLFAILMTCFACQAEPKQDAENNSNGTTEETPTVTSSSVSKEETTAVTDVLTPEVESKINGINEFMSEVKKTGAKLVNQNYKPATNHPKDNVFVSRKEGKVVRATTSFFLEDGETRDYYFFKNGEIVFFKHREWYPEIESPYAKEMIAYFEGDQVLDIQERKVNLKPGERPHSLLQAPVQASKIDRDSFRQVVFSDWERISDGAGVN